MSVATRNLALAALFAGAYASNPDERSFRWLLERRLRRSNDPASIIESKVHSFLSTQTVTRHNYFLFSVIRMPEERSTYFGMFGNWIRLPGFSRKPVQH